MTDTREPPLVLRGSCLCAGVAFEIHGPLSRPLYCHCGMCRKAHGTAFRARAGVAASHFQWVRGDDLVTWYESSPGTHRGFCRVCGANLINRFDAHPDQYGLALGALDDDPEVRPQCHVFVADKAPWFEITDTLPRYDGFPPRA